MPARRIAVCWALAGSICWLQRQVQGQGVGGDPQVASDQVLDLLLQLPGQGQPQRGPRVGGDGSGIMRDEWGGAGVHPGLQPGACLGEGFLRCCCCAACLAEPPDHGLGGERRVARELVHHGAHGGEPGIQPGGAPPGDEQVPPGSLGCAWRHEVADPGQCRRGVGGAPP